MVLVPCCWAQVAHTLRSNKALALACTPLAGLASPAAYAEFGSQLTSNAAVR